MNSCSFLFTSPGVTGGRFDMLALFGRWAGVFLKKSTGGLGVSDPPPAHPVIIGSVGWQDGCREALRKGESDEARGHVRT